mmetsp:Transcript_24765/g.79988  ORF Transcript_24765/g.79988 Transcript_24765/m.79988 type:complete len:266 (+) Transcript_24765:507-1304(+)
MRSCSPYTKRFTSTGVSGPSVGPGGLRKTEPRTLSSPMTARKSPPWPAPGASPRLKTPACSAHPPLPPVAPSAVPFPTALAAPAAEAPISPPAPMRQPKVRPTAAPASRQMCSRMVPPAALPSSSTACSSRGVPSSPPPPPETDGPSCWKASVAKGDGSSPPASPPAVSAPICSGCTACIQQAAASTMSGGRGGAAAGKRAAACCGIKFVWTSPAANCGVSSTRRRKATLVGSPTVRHWPRAECSRRQAAARSGPRTISLAIIGS